MVYLVDDKGLIGIGVTIVIGVLIFVLADVVLDMFGIELKQGIKNRLPEGFKTKGGEVTK